MGFDTLVTLDTGKDTIGIKEASINTKNINKKIKSKQEDFNHSSDSSLSSASSISSCFSFLFGSSFLAILHLLLFIDLN